jgi:type IV pilus assembly protein PilO
MPDLRRTRKKMKIALAVLAGVDLLAAALYFSPLIGSAESRQQVLSALQLELSMKTKAAAPLENLPQKVELAGQQISEFYKNRFPNHNSQILTELGKLAAANGVRIEQARYKSKDSSNAKEVPVPGLQAFGMEADMAGSYTGLAKFINALERDEMFFIINNVTLGGEPQGQVKLSVSVETYLKESS